MIGASYKINAWGNYIIVLWFAAIACLFISLWYSFYEFRQLVRDIQNSYYYLKQILEVING